MPKMTIIVLALALFLALASSTLSGKGQAVEVTPVNATFTDNASDHIRSDGRGAYLNGVNGVQSVIDLLDDFILQLNFSGKRTALRRQMVFDFTDPVGTALNRGTINDVSFLNVDSIRALAVGEWRYSQAQFNTAIGLLRFNPANYPGTSYVHVLRTSDTTWVITASAASGGDVAALVQQAKNNTFTQVGQYHMPFQITVQLP